MAFELFIVTLTSNNQVPVIDYYGHMLENDLPILPTMLGSPVFMP